jgi:hypothetical protein
MGADHVAALDFFLSGHVSTTYAGNRREPRQNFKAQLSVVCSCILAEGMAEGPR